MPTDNTLQNTKTTNTKKLELVVNDSKDKLRVASMFSGCGGLDYAFHKTTAATQWSQFTLGQA